MSVYSPTGSGNVHNDVIMGGKKVAAKKKMGTKASKAAKVPAVKKTVKKAVKGTGMGTPTGVKTSGGRKSKGFPGNPNS